MFEKRNRDLAVGAHDIQILTNYRYTSEENDEFHIARKHCSWWYRFVDCSILRVEEVWDFASSLAHHYVVPELKNQKNNT